MQDKSVVIPNVCQEFPFERTPVIGAWVREFAKKVDTAVGSYGLSLGLRSVLLSKGGSIHTAYDDETTKSLLQQQKPIVLVSTHASLAEPFAILSSLSELSVTRNIRFFMADGVPQLPNLNSFVLPLYNTVNPREIRPDTTIFRLLGGKAGHVDPGIARTANHRQFEFASNFINMGNMILLFPEGNRPKNGDWPPGGIGRLLANIGRNSGASVIFVETAGANWFDLSLLVCPYSLKRPFLHTIVHYSKPILVSEIIQIGQNDKARMSLLMRQQYRQWVM
jgi:hypothetical protein